MSEKETNESFGRLGVSAEQCSVLRELGYEMPTPIQTRCIPELISGRDVVGQAQTGTGKTAAFALPFLNKLDTKKREPQLLVLAPTRELAIQVSESFQAYARKLKNFDVVPIFGGQGMDRQLKRLKRGPQVVVGTPGRIMDHMRRKTLKLGSISAVVLDEADEMLKMGFLEDVEWILERCPEQKQVALFSATMPKQIRAIANRHLNDPSEIKIHSTTKTIELVDQFYWQVTGTHKLDAITRILEVEDYDGVIVFVRTRASTIELAEKLRARGHTCSALNGDMNQRDRERTIERLKEGKLNIVVATDVAARGLDVKRVSHVINYDIPYDAEAYVHRIGRTGRAGRSGKAVLFVSPRERRLLKAIERSTKASIREFTLPTRDELVAHRVSGLKAEISERINKGNLGYHSELIKQLMAEEQVSAVEVAAALVSLHQKKQTPLPSESRDDSNSVRRNRRSPGRTERRRDSRRVRSGPKRAGGRKNRGRGNGRHNRSHQRAGRNL